MLSEDEVNNQYGEIISQEISETEKALRLFLYISKNQIFWNSNVDTALLIANKIMFNKCLALLSVPENVYMKFNELLSKYYNSNLLANESNIIIFIYEHCIFGINYS